MALPDRTDAHDPAEPRHTGRPAPAVLEASLEALARLYRGLWRLSSRQHRLIETGDLNRLVQVLEAKDVLVERIKESQPRVERVVAAWRASSEEMGEPDRRRVEPLLDEINDLLARVMAADAEDGQRLTCRRAVVASKLSQRTRSLKAARAYRGSGAPAIPDPPGGRLNLKDQDA